MAMTQEVMQASINALQVEVSALRFLVEDVKKQSDHHDQILIRGYEDHLPLAEIVRNLTKTVSDYIGQKDREEQKKKEEWNRIKWIIIGIAVPAVSVFIGQAIIFYFKIYPILERLTQP